MKELPGEGKMEEFKEKLKRSRMIGKVTGRLSRRRRRVIPSGPAELDEFLKSALQRTSGVIWAK